MSTNGRVHSEGGIRITGSRTELTGGTEYTTSIDTTGSRLVIDPAARRVAAGAGAPLVPDIADYRPGGALAGGDEYHPIPQSACKGGTWSPDDKVAYSGIVYVPCSVRITGSRKTLGATLVAEGTVTVTGSRNSVGGPSRGEPAIISGSSAETAVSITGSRSEITGTVFAPDGGIRATGSRGVFNCGLLGQKVSITGSRTTIPMSTRCLQEP